MATLDSLLVQIDASTELLRRELQKGGSAVDGFARNTDRRLSGMAGSFGKVTSMLRGTLAAFGVGFGVTAVASFTKGAIQAADAIGETARAAGFGAERFQRLSFVFRQNGVNAQEFEGAMRTANTRLGQFVTTGAGPAAKAIEQLGLKQRIANGEIKNGEQFVDAIMGALGNVSSSAQRAALAAQFFGREAGAKLQDTLSRGTAAINEAADAATGIFSDDTVRKADELADAWERIAAAAGSYAKTRAVEVSHSAARALGVDGLSGPSQEEQLAALRRDRMRPMEDGETFADWSQRIARIDKELADLEAQIARPKFTTGGRFGVGIGDNPETSAPNDGLHEISAHPRTSGLQQFDFAAASAAALNNQLQEVSVKLIKMPDDLVKLSPEFNTFVASLQRGVEETKELQKAQHEMVNFFGDALQSTLADAFMGVETNFKQLLKRMAAELAASALTKSFMAMLPTTGFGKFFTGLFGGARAMGGPVQSGKGYLVNEGRPELFWPGVSGSMIPVGAGGGGAPITVINNIDARGADASLIARLPKILDDNSKKTRADILHANNRGRRV